MSTASDKATRVRGATESLAKMPQRLRDAREQSGVSLRQLAQRVDISASAISQIETGKSQPSLRTLLGIVGELNLSLDELFDNKPGTNSS